MPGRPLLLRAAGLTAAGPGPILRRMFVSGVLLAAGASSRFGAPKMLATVDAAGTPMLRKVLETFTRAPLEEVVVVVRPDDTALAGFFRDFSHVAAAQAAAGIRKTRFVENPRWQGGMFTSVKAGLAAIDPRSTHVAVSPADLPFLGEESLRRVLDAAASLDGRTLLVPTHAGRRGHPLVFSAALVSRILSWPDDRRLSDLLREPDLSTFHLVGFDDGILRDVDRPQDLSRVRSS